MIDPWFIDKIAILVEMETRLKTEELTTDLLKEAKRIEFPDKVIASLSGKTEEQVKKMRYEMASQQPLRWLIHVQQSLKQLHHIIILFLEARMRRKRQMEERRFLFLVLDRFVSDRVLSLTSVLFIVI